MKLIRHHLIRNKRLFTATVENDEDIPSRLWSWIIPSLEVISLEWCVQLHVDTPPYTPIKTSARLKSCSGFVSGIYAILLPTTHRACKPLFAGHSGHDR